MSHGNIKRTWILKTRPKPKVNVQLHWISLFSKSSWIKTTSSGLSYELEVNSEKELMETGILLIKMDITHYTGKPGNFNSFKRHNLNYIVTLLP